MGRKLAKAVAVIDDAGELRTFRAGDEAPDWLEDRVTNPKVWAEDVPEVEPRSVPTSELPEWQREGAEAVRSVTEHERRAAGAKASESGDNLEPEDTGESEPYDPEMGPPPKGGEGSARDNWAAYAEANDLGVTESMSREDIIALCDRMEIPTE